MITTILICLGTLILYFYLGLVVLSDYIYHLVHFPAKIPTKQQSLLLGFFYPIVWILFVGVYALALQEDLPKELASSTEEIKHQFEELFPLSAQAVSTLLGK